MKKILSALDSGEYDIVVMDEVCTALYFKLLNTESVVAAMQNKPEKVELILTGRYAPQAIVDAADLVTEMAEVKHYYQKNIESRKGIEN